MNIARERSPFPKTQHTHLPVSVSFKREIVPKAGRKLLCGGGGVTRNPIFPTPPPSLLGRRDGRGEFRAGVPDLPCRGGGGSTQHLWLEMIPTLR